MTQIRHLAILDMQHELVSSPVTRDFKWKEWPTQPHNFQPIVFPAYGLKGGLEIEGIAKMITLIYNTTHARRVNLVTQQRM